MNRSEKLRNRPARPAKSGRGGAATLSPIADYSRLLQQVKETLIAGQARIEAERVRTYWETGKLIHEHILKNADRAEYGAKVLARLAEDLGISDRLMRYCIQFVKAYPRIPILNARSKFSWTHYRGLITVADDKARLRLEDQAGRNDWSADELALRIKDGNPSERQSGVLASGGKLTGADKDKPLTPRSGVPLKPLRGTLYTYRLVERPNLGTGGASGLLVDLGFGIYHDVESRLLSVFGKDDIVGSKPKEDAYKFYKVERAAKDLFTYAAYVEKVIDGDTLKVRLDLGFNVWNRQTLRLRDIDCPEVGTPAGDEARDFVRSHLKETQMIIVRSSRSDKYDRYLADVYIPQGEGSDPATDIYLNNLLLETGRAVRMG